MIAHLDADGVLHIAPETPTEAFALRAYGAKACVWVNVPAVERTSPTMDKKLVIDASYLLINAAWPQEQAK